VLKLCERHVERLRAFASRTPALHVLLCAPCPICGHQRVASGSDCCVPKVHHCACACSCGECNGSGAFVDVLHACCAGVLDAAGVCCESGALDDCGACDGDHASCSKALQLGAMLPDYEAAANLTQPAVFSAFRCAP
jgi:hypothetical protein